MSKTFFEISEFEQRHRRVRAAMAAEKMALLLVMSPINIMYLVGSAIKSYQGFNVCFSQPILSR